MEEMMGNFNKLVTFAYSVQGADHIQKENDQKNILHRKYPCQDRSYFGDFEPLAEDKIANIQLYVQDKDAFNKTVYLPVTLKKHSIPFSCLCVSDGHGSSPYFRSQRGAEISIQSFIELVSGNIKMLSDCYKNKEFLKIEKGLSVGLAHNRWTEKIVDDLTKNPLTDSELTALCDDDKDAADLYEKEYKKFISLTELSEKIKFMYSSHLRQIYGCTFIGYIQTNEFWYALQIGDGDLAISYGKDKFVLPIPEDSRCLGCETTSMCSSKSYEDFRFAHGDDIPKYVFASSDGIANSVTAGDEGLFNFYKWVANRFTDIEFEECRNCFKNNNLDDAYCNMECRIDKAKKFIAEDLPKQSKKGSGDDFSLAAIINLDDSILERIKKYTFYRKGNQLLNIEKSKGEELIQKAIEYGNPYANYDKGCFLLKTFCDDLLRNEFSDTKKEVIKNHFSKIGKKGRDKIAELYIEIAKYLLSNLQKKLPINQVLYDETLNNLTEGTELYIKLQTSYSEFLAEEIKNSNMSAEQGKARQLISGKPISSQERSVNPQNQVTGQLEIEMQQQADSLQTKMESRCSMEQPLTADSSYQNTRKQEIIRDDSVYEPGPMKKFLAKCRKFLAKCRAKCRKFLDVCLRLGRKKSRR